MNLKVSWAEAAEGAVRAGEPLSCVLPQVNVQVRFEKNKRMKMKGCLYMFPANILGLYALTSAMFLQSLPLMADA